MYTRRQKFVLASFSAKTVIFVAAACFSFMKFGTPQAGSLNFCQQQILNDTKSPSLDQWAGFEEWCEQNVNGQEKDAWGHSAYMWWNKRAMDKCHAYSRCTTEATWQAVVVLAAGVLLYADYLSDITAISSFLFRGHDDHQRTFRFRSVKGKASRSGLSDIDNETPKPEKENEKEDKKEKEKEKVRTTTPADPKTPDLLTSHLVTPNPMASDLLTPYENARYEVLCREREVQMQGDHDYQFSFYEGDEPEIVITYEY